MSPGPGSPDPLTEDLLEGLRNARIRISITADMNGSVIYENVLMVRYGDTIALKVPSPEEVMMGADYGQDHCSHSRW